jgi:hypothetical protein
MSEGAELLQRLAHIRAELDECGRLLREVGTKAEARALADLREQTNVLEIEVKEAKESGV